MNKPIKRTIAANFVFLLLLSVFTSITACSSSQDSIINTSNSNKTMNSTENTSNSSEEIRDFKLSGNTLPKLIVNNDVGSVDVDSANNANNVHVKVTKSQGNPSDIQTNYSQSGNTVTITIKRSNTSSTAKADAEITLPSKADLQLQNGTGDINVKGVEGQMSLTNGTGSIKTTQVKLTRTSQLQTGTGDVNFSGSIGGGNYQFQSSTGNVAVSLPSTASFRVNATTDVGNISSDFPSVQVQQNMVGASASGSVGSAPSATVTLTAATGSIDLKQE